MCGGGVDATMDVRITCIIKQCPSRYLYWGCPGDYQWRLLICLRPSASTDQSVALQKSKIKARIFDHVNNRLL